MIAINEAINNQVTDETVSALENPAAHLVNVNPDLSEEYQSVLYAALSSKAEITRNKVSGRNLVPSLRVCTHPGKPRKYCNLLIRIPGLEHA